MNFRRLAALGIFGVGLLMTAGIILAAAGAMFHHGLNSTGVLWLLGWAAIFGFLAGCAEMARREREAVEEFAAPEGGLLPRERA